MRLKLLFALLLNASLAFAQVPAPQIPLTGTIGSGGIFPLNNAGTLIFSADANRTMVYPETSAGVIKVTSSVSLTATRNLVAPLAIGFMFVIENATTGGQSIQVIGSSGVGVTIPNGSAVVVICDGTNYVSAGGGGGSSAFSSITSGENTTATMTVGTGAELLPSGSGEILASALANAPTQCGGDPTLPVAIGVDEHGNALCSPAVTSTTTNNNNGAAAVADSVLNIPHYTGVASPRTSGHCAEFDTNGIDLIDAGSACGSGGFANPMTTLGDLIYGGTSGTATRLAGNTTNTALYLCQTGTGSASAAPSWCSISGGVALQTNGTNNTSQTTLNFINSSTNAAGLTFTFSNPSGGNEQGEIAGILNPTHGGTGSNTAPSSAQIYVAQSSTDVEPKTMSGSCTISNAGVISCPPAVTYELLPAATSTGGGAFAGRFSYYDNNAPTVGSYNTTQSTDAYLQFIQAPSSPEYAQARTVYPAYWTSTSAYATFSSSVTSGNVTWTIQTACVTSGTTLGSEAWTTGVTVTTTVPGTSGNAVQTAVFSNIGAPAAGGCPSSPTVPGELAVRIYRGNADTAAGYAQLESVTLATSRSQ